MEFLLVLFHLAMESYALSTQCGKLFHFIQFELPLTFRTQSPSHYTRLLEKRWMML